MIRNTLEDFIRKARNVHGDKYDYSKVVYVNNKTPVIISCSKHGDFKQRPDGHLHGNGCPFCGVESKKKLIRGVAINDTFVSRLDPAFKTWNDMLRRCFPITKHEIELHINYADCTVCDDWLKFSNFWYWYQENGVDGYHLDKDLFSNGHGKIYSPDTCCFLPHEINTALQCEHRGMRKKGNKLFYNKGHHTFESKLNIKGKTVGIGRFNTEEEAINAYIQRKEEYIKQLAEEYYSKNLISYKIFNKLINFKVRYGNN